MHTPPCEPLKKCKEETSDRLTTLEEKMCKVESNTDSILEIVNTWNNTKGFVTTVRVISKVIIWTSLVTASVTGIWQAFKHFGQS